MNQLKALIDSAGGPELAAKACGISARAVYKWVQRGAMPRTEYTGETQYSTLISKVSGGTVKADQLLEAGARNQAA